MSLHLTTFRLHAKMITMTTDTNDPTLTLLEDRFLSSGYRRSLLEDRLHNRCDFRGALIGNLIDFIRNIPTRREWCPGPIYSAMRIEFSQLPSNEDLLGDYLRAFYVEVERDVSVKERTRVVYTVKVSPHDTQWLAIVSAYNAKRIEWKE